jgi:hypothetical protein
MSKIEECIARMQESTTRVQVAAASLCATIQRWADLRVAKLERRVPSGAMSMRQALESESILPRWKKRPHSFHTLASGEVVVFGGDQTAHTMRVDEVKTTYTQCDVDYLKQVVVASRVIVAEEADRILRTMKPDTSRSKRRPAEADPDPDMRMDYRSRPERCMTAEDLAREQFTGRSLARELARIGRTL